MFHGLAVQAQEQGPAPGPSIRVDVSRVNVGVIVTDSKGKFVEGLQRDNFQIADNGTPQAITDFAPVDAPTQVLLLIEAGPAVYFLQDSHLLVASSLLHGLSAADLVAIASYSDAPNTLLDFTSDKSAAEAALDHLQFNLGYGELNLARSLSVVLGWLAHIRGKKTIVLLSTGMETSSVPEIQSLILRLQAADVRILAISMSYPLRSGKRGSKQQIQQTQQEFEKADKWLKSLAEATGGRAYFPENSKSFQETYRQVAELVRHEYSLAFAPPVADGAMHSIDVTVNPLPVSTTEYRVDHRKAYVAPKPTG
jgi:VWFA-related protein